MSQDSITTPHAVFQEDLNQEVDVVVQDKLAKANITEHALATLKAEAEAVTGPIRDEAHLKLVQGVISKAVNMRNVAVRICEHGRKPAIMLQRAWIAKEKELVNLIRLVEEPLEQSKQAWLDEQERIKKEEEAAKERARVARYVALEELGFMRRTSIGNPDEYVLAGTHLRVADIDAADHDTWANMLRSAGITAAEEEERKEKERAEREEFERQRRELAEQQAKMRQYIIDGRKKELIQAGMFEDEDEPRLFIGDMEVWDDTLPLRSETEMKALITEAKDQRAQWDKYIEEQAAEQARRDEQERARLEELKRENERQRLVVLRVQQLVQFGYEVLPYKSPEGKRMLGLPSTVGGSHNPVISEDGLADVTEEQMAANISFGKERLTYLQAAQEEATRNRILAEEAAKAEAEQKRREAEELERKARMSDQERLQELLTVIATAGASAKDIRTSLKSEIAKQAMTKVLTHLKNAHDVITGTMKDIQ